jgi:hypothetical protein
MQSPYVTPWFSISPAQLPRFAERCTGNMLPSPSMMWLQSRHVVE